MWGVGNQQPSSQQQGGGGQGGQGGPPPPHAMQPGMLPHGMQGLPPGMQGMPYAMPPYHMMPGFGMPPMPHHFQQNVMGMPEVAQATAGGKIRRKRRKQEKGGPKKPATAFVLFSNEQRESVKAENPGISFTDIGRKLGEMWREMEAEMKKRYELRATAAKDKYMAEKKIWLEDKDKDPKEIEQKAAEARAAAANEPAEQLDADSSAPTASDSSPPAAAVEPTEAAPEEGKSAEKKDEEDSNDEEGGEAADEAGKGDGEGDGDAAATE